MSLWEIPGKVTEFDEEWSVESDDPDLNMRKLVSEREKCVERLKHV